MGIEIKRMILAAAIVVVINLTMYLLRLSSETNAEIDKLQNECQHKVSLNNEERNIIKDTPKDKNLLIPKMCTKCMQTVYISVNGTKEN